MNGTITRVEDWTATRSPDHQTPPSRCRIEFDNGERLDTTVPPGIYHQGERVSVQFAPDRSFRMVKL